MAWEDDAAVSHGARHGVGEHDQPAGASLGGQPVHLAKEEALGVRGRRLRQNQPADFERLPVRLLL